MRIYYIIMHSGYYQRWYNYMPVNIHVQYNLNGSNTDGSFTMDDSNSFFQSLQKSSNSSRKQIFRDFFYFILELYVVCTH